jgi:PEP-CTERM motif-containing protein
MEEIIMRLSVIRCYVLLTLAVVGVAPRSNAAPIVVPPGLSPGDTYRLVFVTSTTRDATSTAIGDYNTFVSTAANSVPELAALGATWFAIGSTRFGHAFDNIGGAFSEGVYRLDGGLVAAGSAILWGGALLSPISLTEQVTLYDGPVWTGTMQDGGASPFFVLGSLDWVLFGLSLSGGTSCWTNCTAVAPDNIFPLYGISSTLTAPSEIPEPGTIGLTALGGALLFLARRRKQRNVRATQTARTTPAHH